MVVSTRLLLQGLALMFHPCGFGVHGNGKCFASTTPQADVPPRWYGVLYTWQQQQHILCKELKKPWTDLIMSHPIWRTQPNPSKKSQLHPTRLVCGASSGRKFQPAIKIGTGTYRFFFTQNPTLKNLYYPNRSKPDPTLQSNSGKKKKWSGRTQVEERCFLSELNPTQPEKW